MVAQDVSAFRSNVVNLTGGEIPEQIKAEQVTVNYFRPLRRAGADGPHVHRARGPARRRARRRPQRGLLEAPFAHDPQILGKTILLGGDPHVVVGVIGADFDFRKMDAPPDVWIPFQLVLNNDQEHYFTAAGRLKPGVTLAQAKARLQLSAEDFKRKYPRSLQEGQGFSVKTIREATNRRISRAFTADEKAALLTAAAARRSPSFIRL
jgi:hypothetical protein